VPVEIRTRCGADELIFQSARIRLVRNILDEPNDVDGERVRPLFHVLTPLIHGGA
jgi:hypothetical protein